MENEVLLDNLPLTSNYLLNILWDRNRAMTADELIDALKDEYDVEMDRKKAMQFIKILVSRDYVNKRIKGFRAYYSALGMEDVPEEL